MSKWNNERSGGKRVFFVPQQTNKQTNRETKKHKEIEHFFLVGYVRPLFLWLSQLGVETSVGFCDCVLPLTCMLLVPVPVLLAETATHRNFSFSLNYLCFQV